MTVIVCSGCGPQREFQPQVPVRITRRLRSSATLRLYPQHSGRHLLRHLTGCSPRRHVYGPHKGNVLHSNHQRCCLKALPELKTNLDFQLSPLNKSREALR